MKLNGMPPDPHMGVKEENEALARVPDMLAVVKSEGVEPTETLPVVSTSPLLLLPDAVEASSLHMAVLYPATLISASPLAVTRGVRSLCGSHPILTLAEAADSDDILQYSRVLVTSSGGAIEVAVLFGEKYSAVNDAVVPAVETRVNRWPLMEPLPSG